MLMTFITETMIWPKNIGKKFDSQRKAVIQKALTPEQFIKFQEITKDVKFVPRKRK